MRAVQAKLLLVTIAVAACSKRPGAEELARLRAEAEAENQKRAAATVAAIDREISEWTLTIEGQLAAGQGATLTYAELDALATEHARAPHSTLVQADTGASVDYRGVRVSTLLDRLPPTDGVDELTFVAFDGYRSTISAKDARAFPIMLALEADGVRLTRSTAGPLFLVFPIRDYPELARTYNWNFWSFYVNRMIVGTQPIDLVVDGKHLDLAALDALPATILEVAPKLRFVGPEGVVRLRGVAFSALTSRPDVAIRSKTRVWHDVGACNPVLVYRWGADEAPIPARKGGPLIVAFTADCEAHKADTEWPTFVEALE
jgi:hypothetical protein